jgi:hypothetical protein
MDIAKLQRTLMGMPPRHSVLVESKHGMGKSEVIAQTAAAMSVKMNKPFGLVDIRLGQYEIGDLIGIPRARDTYTITNKVFRAGSLESVETVAQHVTVHDLPLWFPRDPESYGYMFFDELNRGSRDTQQWAMQLVLDYTCNFVDVPLGWRVIAACNDDYDVYNCLNIDPALYDRFAVIKFKPTQKEWERHAEKIGVHDAILKYISRFGSTDLDPPEKTLETGKRYPSRRSWVKFSNVIKHMETEGDVVINDPDYLLHLAKAYVGEAVALNFKEYIQKEYKVYTAKEILDNFPKLKSAFEEMPATDIPFYNKEIINYCVKNTVKLSKKQGVNLFSYVKTIPRECASGFWKQFSVDCNTEAAKWYMGDDAINTYITGLLDKGESTK